MNFTWVDGRKLSTLAGNGINASYVYNGDGFEDAPEYNNKHDLNGSNIMNNDVTSTLTIGVVFEFGKGKKICPLCE